MTLMAHKNWLKISGVLVMLFGPIFVLGAHEPFSEPSRWSLDVLAWPLDGVETYADRSTRLLSALAGGFLMGWGALIWILSGPIYDAAPDPVRKAVLTGYLFWFVFDSTGSILSGAASNAGFNILVLLVLVGPLWRPASA